MNLPLTIASSVRGKGITVLPPSHIVPSYFTASPSGWGLPSVLYLAAKRAIDVLFVLVLFLFLWPLLLLIALLVRRDSPGPVIYRREVLAHQPLDSDPGDLLTFHAYKFRTMVPDADSILENDPQLRHEYEKEFKLRQDPRVTRLGAALRSLSLDEFPQFLNVLRGEMTLVGPRMISPPELVRYGAHGGTLLSVKPGLTGIWQVSGRHCLTYEERVLLDIWYIEHRSLFLDLVILWRTVGSVFSRTGAF
jgi:lipopolysaccharide/colanic/teichoic acid biosynthesis glycosyltransferase